jgi:hypothetical protein
MTVSSEKGNIRLPKSSVRFYTLKILDDGAKYKRQVDRR